MTGIPKVTFKSMLVAAEKDVVEKATAAVRATLALGKDSGDNKVRLDRLIDESIAADISLQEAVALLVSLRGGSMDGAN